MANTLNGYYFDQIDLGSNDSWILGKNAAISTSYYGLYGHVTHNNIDITVKGSILGGQAAILSNSDKTNIVVESTGQLSGEYGVYLSGAHSSIRNAGSILAITGVQAAGEGIKVGNTGLINTTGVGVDLAYASDTFTNGRIGEVHSGSYAVYRGNGSSEENTRTVNYGEITGDNYAFLSSGANDTLINRGKIIGNIVTDSGNDTIDTRGGTINGWINTALGNDTLYTDKASIKLSEDFFSGIDTVYSSVSYKLSDNVEILHLIGKKDINGTGTVANDRLHGNSGNNVLKGLAEADELWGHKGNDKLYGGDGADTFHFATGDGKDVIMDFKDGVDRIYLHDWKAITSFGDLKNNHATNQGDDLLLHAGSDSLLIRNFHKSDMDPGDFSYM
jgi:Ca2+-binding RTX toxin-like protein